MATYVLIHGAGSDSWYWHLVAPKLRALGHDVVAVDLPCEDNAAGLEEYAAVVVDSARDRGALILVAQSLGGFTAPLVCDRLPVALLVLLAAMTPRPGESPGEWWANTGHELPDPFDPAVVFAHDLPPELARQSLEHVREQSGTPFEKPWPLGAWPNVPTRFLLCRDDRFFPAKFQRRVVRDRLGIVPDEMAGGHLPALARPGELVQRLEAYRAELWLARK
ncbi:MAG: alpha/beta hydrolase [Actinomycetota bacterium]|nr:alpha/beta hydrolase [Actinomycetota bacterium]